MKDIRLKETPFELDGKTYLLRCNMNVLADVQEAVGGDLGAALDPKSALKNSLIWLAAMLNDYADEQGWPERFTPAALGRRKFSPGVVGMIADLTHDGLTIEQPDEGTAQNDGNEKN